ncbi:glycosyltransferase [Prosthecobacter sp.]|uniref:glycosyltransferase n=1 Tax=Prosthecobacter sp. TaxID=1965333 RepID=UPI0037839106
MRRLLIICTTFYPDPKVGAIRMTNWARHLPEHGWAVHVLCRHYGYECDVAELAEAVHPEVKLEYLDRPVPGLPGRDGGWRGWLRTQAQKFLRCRSLATLLVPDSAIFFWRKQRQHILRRVRDIRPDVILTSSPPHSNHDIGLWLAAQTGLPWVADFRDPYLTDNRFKPRGLGRLRWWAHERFKASIYRHARLVIHAIPLQARFASRRRKGAQGRLLTLTNAFPPGMPYAPAAAEAGAQGGRLRVLVAGTIPEPEQQVLARALAGLVGLGVDAQMDLIGRVPECAELLRGLLLERVQMPGYLSHAATLREMQQADVLVSFLDEFRGGTFLLSTKLFEYLASGKPVICINPSRSDRHLLYGSSGVEVLVKPSVREITGALHRALSGALRRDMTEVKQFRAEYNWSRRVSQLAEALDSLVAFPPKNACVVKGPPVASIVIPTRNRGELLGQCIRSALAQSVPVEVIVMDDGSTDGTVEMVRREFPMVQCHTLGTGRGPCFQRNRGIQMASAEVVFPIDDDSVFSSPRVVEQTLREFDHPRVAAVGIPFLNPRMGWTEMQRDATPGGCHVIHAFVGASHALRRSVFITVGGFREHFFYMGEEGDLCLRMLANGYVTRLGRADPVYHMESPRRNLALANRCGRRNDIYFAWQNVPMHCLPLHLLATTLNGVKAGLRTWHFWRMLMGTFEGYGQCLSGRVVRQPVNSEVYWLHRQLKKDGPMILEEVEKRLLSMGRTF